MRSESLSPVAALQKNEVTSTAAAGGDVKSGRFGARFLDC